MQLLDFERLLQERMDTSADYSKAMSEKVYNHDID